MNSDNMRTKNFIEDYIDKTIQEHTRIEKLKYDKSSKLYFFNVRDKSKSFEFKNMIKHNRKLKSSLMQNEIASISKISQDKIILFETSTVAPNLNVSLYTKTEEFLLEQWEKQHKEYNKYFKQISYTNRDNKLKYKNIRVYEFTKKHNLHSHKINMLNKIEEFPAYIKSIFLARNKTKIGRIEIAIDEETFINNVLPLFNNNKIIVRLKNVYTPLTIKQEKYNKEVHYTIKESIKESGGNKIYFRLIKDTEQDKTHLTKYLFKYMLKTQDKKDENFQTIYNTETAIFKKLNRQQKVISDYFFSDKTSTEYLKYLNSIIYTNLIRYNKQKENYIGILKGLPQTFIEELNENKNHLIYYVGKLLNENRLYIDLTEENIAINEKIKIRRIIEIIYSIYDKSKSIKFYGVLNTIYKMNSKSFNSEIELQNHYEDIFKNILTDNINSVNRINELITLQNSFYDEGKKQITLNEYIEKYSLTETTETPKRYNEKQVKEINTLTEKFFSMVDKKYNYTNNRKLYYVENDNIYLMKEQLLNEFVLVNFTNEIEKVISVLDYKKDCLTQSETTELTKRLIILHTIENDPSMGNIINHNGKEIQLGEVIYNLEKTHNYLVEKDKRLKHREEQENNIYISKIKLSKKDISIQEKIKYISFNELSEIKEKYKISTSEAKYLKNKYKIMPQTHEIQEIKTSNEKIKLIRQKLSLVS
jgi:hypothetical protein